MSEPSVEEIVARFEPADESQWPGKPITIAEIRALIADWRKRGEAAEAMRAKCEEIARAVANGWGGECGIAASIANAIAALKQP